MDPSLRMVIPENSGKLNVKRWEEPDRCLNPVETFSLMCGLMRTRQRRDQKPPVLPPPVCTESVFPLQVCPCLGGGGRVLWHQLGYFADEVGLLCAAFARLAPLLQDLLQVLHLQLLQVHRGQVQLLVCRRERRRNQG